MLKTLLLASVLAFAYPLAVHAGPKRTLSAFPRAVGRTAANMVTFRDRNLAWHQWALFAGALANTGSSIDLYHRCPNCTERDMFFYGSRPSASRLVVFELLGGMAYSTIQQVSWESSYNKEQPPEWRAVLHWVPTAAPLVGYTWATVHNIRIPSDGSRN